MPPIGGWKDEQKKKQDAAAAARSAAPAGRVDPTRSVSSGGLGQFTASRSISGGFRKEPSVQTARGHHAPPAAEKTQTQQPSSSEKKAEPEPQKVAPQPAAPPPQPAAPPPQTEFSGTKSRLDIEVVHEVLLGKIAGLKSAIRALEAKTATADAKISTEAQEHEEKVEEIIRKAYTKVQLLVSGNDIIFEVYREADQVKEELKGRLKKAKQARLEKRQQAVREAVIKERGRASDIKNMTLSLKAKASDFRESINSIRKELDESKTRHESEVKTKTTEHDIEKASLVAQHEAQLKAEDEARQVAEAALSEQLKAEVQGLKEQLASQVQKRQEMEADLKLKQRLVQQAKRAHLLCKVSSQEMESQHAAKLQAGRQAREEEQKRIAAEREVELQRCEEDWIKKREKLKADFPEELESMRRKLVEEQRKGVVAASKMLDDLHARQLPTPTSASLNGTEVYAKRPSQRMAPAAPVADEAPPAPEKKAPTAASRPAAAAPANQALARESSKEEAKMSPQDACPKGHRLQRTVLTRDDAFCDVCRQTLPKGGVLWGCRTCNWDQCSACRVRKVNPFSQLHAASINSTEARPRPDQAPKAGAGGSGERGSEALRPWRQGSQAMPGQAVPAFAKQPQQQPPGQAESTAMRQTCPAYHGLQRTVTDRDGGYCDRCKTTFKKGVALWGCRACNWDTCEPCLAKFARSMQAASPVWPQQANPAQRKAQGPAMVPAVPGLAAVSLSKATSLHTVPPSA
eukprot:TRINITY_DN5715_c0_g1_i9.p1 TRINITY_DN5715_c0_g1~~TRINITY_DN5715_c0_g1_i9.p1  ORF type:complete len:745 (-),score=243.55 TRINITY_DN5715_c0_g1_i9:446-2680(-)